MLSRILKNCLTIPLTHIDCLIFVFVLLFVVGDFSVIFVEFFIIVFNVVFIWAGIG